MQKANNDNSKQVRLLLPYLDNLEARYASRQDGANRFFAYAIRMEKHLHKELKGYFSKEEITLMLDISNGIIISPPLWGNRDAFCMGLSDADELDSAGARHGVDVKTLIEKVKKMPGSLFMAFHEEIHRFWNEAPAWGAPSPDLEKFLEKYTDDGTPYE